MAYIFTKLAQVDSISDIDNLNLNIIVENDGEINRVATDLIQPDFSKLKDDLIFNDINLYLQNNEDNSKGNLTIHGNLSGLKDAKISGSLTSDQLIVQTEATVHNIYINGNWICVSIFPNISPSHFIHSICIPVISSTSSYSNLSRLFKFSIASLIIFAIVPRFFITSLCSISTE